MRFLQLLGAVILLQSAGCVWNSSSHFIPHATFKLVLQGDMTEQQAIDDAERALLALGYEKQPNDWEEWTFLKPDELELKKLERWFKKDNLHVRYRPDASSEYRALRTPFLHFYEYNEYVFSQRGIDEYEAIRSALIAAGLTLGIQQAVDTENARAVRTPADFNAENEPPSVQERSSSVLFGLLAAGIYGLVVLWPGYRICLGITRKAALSRGAGIALFVAASAAILAPAPMPLSMFGPVLLVPWPLLLPFAIEAPSSLLPFLSVSVVITVAIGLLVALKCVKAPVAAAKDNRPD